MIQKIAQTRVTAKMTDAKKMNTAISVDTDQEINGASSSHTPIHTRVKMKIKAVRL